MRPPRAPWALLLVTFPRASSFVSPQARSECRVQPLKRSLPPLSRRWMSAEVEDPTALRAALEKEREKLLLEKDTLSAELESVKALDRLIDKMVDADMWKDFKGSWDRLGRKVGEQGGAVAFFLRLDERIQMQVTVPRMKRFATFADGLLQVLEQEEPATAASVKSALGPRFGLRIGAPEPPTGGEWKTVEDIPSGGGGGSKDEELAVEVGSSVTTVEGLLASIEEAVKKGGSAAEKEGLQEGKPVTVKLGTEGEERNATVVVIKGDQTQVFGADFLKRSGFGENATASFGRMLDQVPRWAPASMQDLLLQAYRNAEENVDSLFDPDLDSSRLEVTKAQEMTLRKRVLNLESGFKLTNVRSSPIAILFEGDAKSGEEASAVYAEVMRRFSLEPELKNLTLLYQPFPTDFLQGLEDEDVENMMDPSELFGQQPKPSFIALPEAVRPEAPSLELGLFAVASLVCATLSTFTVAVGAFALNPAFVERVNSGDVTAVDDVVPLALALIALQLIHDVGHGLAALAYGTQLGPPIVVPSLQLGTFGSIQKFLSFPKTRQELFDVALAGPLLGLVASCGLMLYGLALTSASGGLPPDGLASYPLLPADVFQSSILLHTAAELACPEALAAGRDSVALHPLAVAGLTGTLINALQLMPTGKTDGGRALTATVGRSAAGLVGAGVLFSTAFLGLVAGAGLVPDLLVYWGVLVIIFQRAQDLPCLDEVTDVDVGRKALFAVVAAIVLFTLLPMPPPEQPETLFNF
eukprot:CAMPEP_0172585632 /NCGR_PEP_ID=MMETSP1068-20121228/5034_1 /TAXON_ID=35684 /ORGANISM="Pseudopedinella elastica, Strain CCMP716" /LENGTH=754 /DNA_ID=CAMNT_0013380169 /DNA_START=25 /DNA_END=2289 /DNA_ORIENTATION=+